MSTYKNRPTDNSTLIGSEFLNPKRTNDLLRSSNSFWFNHSQMAYIKCSAHEVMHRLINF